MLCTILVNLKRALQCSRRESLICGLIMAALTSPSSAIAVDGKLGWAGGDGSMADATNSHWYYNWWHTKPAGADVANADWIPLVKYPNNLQNKLDIVTGYNDVDTILVLNEPERADQSDVTVAEAISIWPQFEATGLNLITPAISDNAEGQNWLADFMSQATANNYRMDGLAFHWYGASTPNNPAGAANNFLNRVDHYWNTYGLPVWITEFAIHDWGGNYTDQQILNANEQFLDIVVPALESRSYVEAYSFYHWFTDATLIEDVGGLWTPTNVGDAYIPSYRAGDNFDVAGQSHGNDTIYVRGGTVVNSGAAVDNAIKTIYAVDGTSSLAGSSDWGVDGAGVVEINVGATLQKTATNTVSINGAAINNRGDLRAVGGVLELRDGVQVAGAGVLHLDPGGTVSLGSPTDRNGTLIGQSIAMHGGTIRANPVLDGTHTVTGASTIHSTSTISGDGLLVVNGPLSAPSGGGGGGLVKEGAGTLYLRAANTFEGDTIVRQGTLRLASTGSLAATPRLVVEESGTLQVTEQAGGFALNNQRLEVKGQVLGSIVASAGSQISALTSSNSISGDLTVSNSTVSVGGSGFNESTPVPPIVTAGLELEFNAALDLGGDSTWTNTAASGGDLSFAGNATPTGVAAPSYPGITAAYDIPSSGGTSGLNQYFEGLAPQRSRRDASFEVVFHVSDTAAGGDQVIFELGGSGRGVAFLLDGDTLNFNVNGDDVSTSSISSTLTPGWHHAVGVIDLVGQDDNLANDSISLYVDNTLIGTLDNLLVDDWAGGNTSGIGEFSSSLGAGGSPITYHESIAIVRYYNGFAFEASEVEQNYTTLIGSGVALPSTMQVDGNYMQMSDSTLEIDLLSPTMHDVLNVTGIADLAGTLEVGEIAGFDPDYGDLFVVLNASSGVNGQFDSLLLPTLTAGKLLVPIYGADSVTLAVAGSVADFDFDGDVDNDDLIVWQSALGVSSAGDANQDGVTNGLDFLIWQQELIEIGATLSSTSAIPEPSAATLLVLAVLNSQRRRLRF